MTDVTHLRISRLNFTKSTNINMSIISEYYSIPNISVSVNYVPKRYNAVVLNPVMNNY